MLLVAPILFIAAVLYVAYPLLTEEQPEVEEAEAGATRQEALLAEKDNLIASLKDIEMDHRTAKLSDEDYQRLKVEFEQRAIGILKKLDRQEEPASEPRPQGGPHPLENE